MTINYLIENINKKDFDIESELKIKKYIPIIEKKKIAMDIVAECVDDFNDFIEVDRFKMNIVFNMRMLKEHTNLDISINYDEMIKEYDELCESGAIYTVCEYFISDYGACELILNQEVESFFRTKFI